MDCLRFLYNVNVDRLGLGCGRSGCVYQISVSDSGCLLRCRRDETVLSLVLKDDLCNRIGAPQPD